MLRGACCRISVRIISTIIMFVYMTHTCCTICGSSISNCYCYSSGHPIASCRCMTHRACWCVLSIYLLHVWCVEAWVDLLLTPSCKPFGSAVYSLCDVLTTQIPPDNVPNIFRCLRRPAHYSSVFPKRAAKPRLGWSLGLG